jgi:hypothetical protein
MQTDGSGWKTNLSSSNPMTAACVHNTTHTTGAEGLSNAAEANYADFGINSIELCIAVDNHFLYLLF